MKRTLLIITIALLGLNVQAQIKSSLTIFSKNGEKFWIVRNGVKQNNEPQTSVTIKNIEEKSFRIKVLIDDEKLTSVDKLIYTENVDGQICDLSYELKANKKGKYSLGLISFEPAKEPVVEKQDKPIKHYPPRDTRQADVKIEQEVKTDKINQQTATAGKDGVSVKVNDSELGINMNFEINIPADATVTSSQTTTTTTTTNRHGNVENSRDRNYNNRTNRENTIRDTPTRRKPETDNRCKTAMPAADFADATAQIKSVSFAEDKLNIAKQIAKGNCLSVNQIKEICKLFSFEDNKLEFAKYAYDFTFEQNRYYLLNDVFSFSSSRDELNKYINSK
jgi:hypothetical protein